MVHRRLQADGQHRHRCSCGGLWYRAVVSFGLLSLVRVPSWSARQESPAKATERLLSRSLNETKCVSLVATFGQPVYKQSAFENST